MGMMYSDSWEKMASSWLHNWSTAYMKLQSGPVISLQLQWLPLRRSQKLQNAVTIAQSASSHIQQKIAATTIRKFEVKIEDAIWENQFGFGRG